MTVFGGGDGGGGLHRLRCVQRAHQLCVCLLPLIWLLPSSLSFFQSASYSFSCSFPVLSSSFLPPCGRKTSLSPSLPSLSPPSSHLQIGVHSSAKPELHSPIHCTVGPIFSHYYYNYYHRHCDYLTSVQVQTAAGRRAGRQKANEYI